MSISNKQMQEYLERRKQENFTIKAFVSEAKEIDEDAHTAWIRINDNSIDRDNEIVLPKSFDKYLDFYLNNPVVMFAHDYYQPPIGKMVDYKITDEFFDAQDQFAVDESDHARLCWNLISSGYMKAASIGFIPIEFETPDDIDEDDLSYFMSDTIDIDKVIRIYTECELLEHSILPVGSNRNALKKIYMQTSGKWDKQVVDLMEKMIEEQYEYEAERVADKIAKKLSESQRWYGFTGILEKEIEKPYENSHACDIRDKNDFQEDSFVSQKREHDGKEYTVRLAKLEGEDTLTEQSYLYDKEIWTSSSAQSHCESHDGTFEPASGEENIGGENMDKKGVVSYQDLPLADRNRSWDADEAVKRLRSWAGGPDKDEISWTKYRKGFTWYDSSESENFGSYKLPLADVINDSLKAVPRGIFAVAAVLQGARGGIDIPENDISSAKTHIAKYYHKMDLEAPWEREEEDVDLALLELKELKDQIKNAEGKAQEITHELAELMKELKELLIRNIKEVEGEQIRNEDDNETDDEKSTDIDTEDDEKSIETENDEKSFDDFDNLLKSLNEKIDNI